MNVLLLSVGTRNKVVQCFKKTLGENGRVIATDASNLAPAIYEADQYYIVPSITDPEYITKILEICRQEQIAGILSFIDPELSLIAKHEEQFKAIGVTIIGSSYDLCEMALNKYHMFQWLTEHGYLCAQSWIDKEQFYTALEKGQVSFPVFVKPVKGSASIDIFKANDRETIEFLFTHHHDLMIQQYLGGQEFGADVYADLLSGEVVSIFIKKKLKMRAGETDKAVSFKDPRLFELIERFITEASFKGPVDIDIMKIDGEYYISEVNPRFGGGYPHAYECGADHMIYILENLRGKTNPKAIGQYKENIYMMKYNEVMIKDGNR